MLCDHQLFVGWHHVDCAERVLAPTGIVATASCAQTSFMTELQSTGDPARIQILINFCSYRWKLHHAANAGRARMGAYRFSTGAFTARDQRNAWAEWFQPVFDVHGPGTDKGFAAEC